MGRKLKYNEPTKVVGVRVPESKSDELTPLLNEYVVKYCKTHKPK